MTLPPSWKVTVGAITVPASPPVPIPIGPTHQITLSSQVLEFAPEDNLTDVGLRTLVECGSLGARVQTGVLAKLVDPTRPAIVKLSLPRTLWVQSIRGSAVAQSEVDYSDPAAVVITLALQPARTRQRFSLSRSSLFSRRAERFSDVASCLGCSEEYHFNTRAEISR